jgi:hypothetical protein
MVVGGIWSTMINLGMFIWATIPGAATPKP